MSALSIALLAAGSLLVLALAAYALYLWRRVWQQQKALAAAEQERQQRLGGDLRVLAGSLLDEQLPLIEGAIRIKVLLDNYDSALSNDSRCRCSICSSKPPPRCPRTRAGKRWTRPNGAASRNASPSWNYNTRPLRVSLHAGCWMKG